MVLIWIDLAGGDREAAALLVAINSVIQVLAYALLGSFYIQILPGWLGLNSEVVNFSLWEIAKAVMIFLGVPLLAGFLTRRIGVRTKGVRWYEKNLFATACSLGPLWPAVHDCGDVRFAGSGHYI